MTPEMTGQADTGQADTGQADTGQADTGPAADVRAFWQGLGLPGLIDLHVHFMPPNVLAKVWAFFESGHAGRPWPMVYKQSEDERVELLRAFGVRRFGALPYPHRADMAAWLNSWSVEFAARTPDAVHSATFFPEPGVLEYVTKAVESGARLFKSHLQVGGYDPRHELLDPVWGLLAQAGLPVVVHCGSAPYPASYTGPGPMAEVLARHPRLVLIVAHLGGPEYGEFLELTDRYPNVYLDTTMAFSDFMNDIAPFPEELLPRLADAGERVVLGTDFPSIPYPYVHQLRALQRAGLGADWLRAVCYSNPARLLAS